MNNIRLFFKESLSNNLTGKLNKDQSHYLLKVMRIKKGDNFNLFNENGELVGITVLKGNNDPKNQDKNDHEVDAISGSTITGDGVTNMIKERLNNYLPYLEKLNIAQL